VATSTYGTPYVQGSDLVSAYPTASSSLATRVDEVSYKRNGLNAQTGTTYTLVAGDAGKTITLSNASPVAVTLPQDSTADLPDGAVVTFYNLGAGTVTISQGAGATLQGGSIVLAQYDVMTVIKLSANTYGRFDGGGGAGMVAATPTSLANTGGSASVSGNTVTFSGVSSLSINGCFTSNYDHYRLIIDFTCSATGRVSSRLRVGGTDNTTASSYANQVLTVNSTTVTGGRTTTDKWDDFLSMNSTRRNAYSVDIYSPSTAVPTQFSAIGNYSLTESSAQFVTGSHNQSTAYDGMTFIPNTGTIAGSLAVYGYKK
jgi:hypothetical protein